MNGRKVARLAFSPLFVAGVLATSPAVAEMLGRFEITREKPQGDAPRSAGFLWSLDTMTGAVSACPATGDHCAIETGLWPADAIGPVRYRIVSHFVDDNTDGSAQRAYLWVMDTTTGAMKRCQSNLAGEPAVQCAK